MSSTIELGGRCPLPLNYKLTLKLDESGGEAVYIIKKLIGAGGSCLVYRVEAFDMSTHESNGITRILKEFYPSPEDKPRIKWLTRNVDNQQIIITEPKSEFEKAKNKIDRKAMQIALDEINNEIEEQESVFASLMERAKNAETKFNTCYENYDTYMMPRPIMSGSANNTYYSVMDKKTGVSLVNWKERNLSAVIRFMTFLCATACEFHHNNDLYLDYKPSNIYVITVDEKTNIFLPALFDFDSVISITEKNKVNYISYSEEWAPSEQRSVYIPYISPQTDIYSLGAVFFYLLTGNAPSIQKDEEYFDEDESDVQAIAKGTFNLEERSKYFKDHSEDVKIKCLDILKNSLAEEPINRYDFADTMHNAFREVLLLTENNVVLNEFDKKNTKVIVELQKKTESNTKRLDALEERASPVRKSIPTKAWILGKHWEKSEPFPILDSNRRDWRTMATILPDAFTLIFATQNESGLAAVLNKLYKDHHLIECYEWIEYNAAEFIDYAEINFKKGIIVNIRASEWSRSKEIIEKLKISREKCHCIINIFSECATQAIAACFESYKCIKSELPFSEIYSLVEPGSIDDYYWWPEVKSSLYQTIEGLNQIINARQNIISSELRKENKSEDLTFAAENVVLALNNMINFDEKTFLLRIRTWVPEIWESLLKYCFNQRQFEKTGDVLKAIVHILVEKDVNILKSSQKYLNELKLYDLPFSRLNQQEKSLLKNVLFEPSDLKTIGTEQWNSLEYWSKNLSINFDQFFCKDIIDKLTSKQGDALKFILIQNESDESFKNLYCSDVVEAYQTARQVVHPK